MQLFDDYAETLLKEKGIDQETLPADIFNQMKAELVLRMLTYINMAIIDGIPDEKIEEYQDLLIKKDETATLEFCKQNIPAFDDLITGCMVDFREVYLDIK